MSRRQLVESSYVVLPSRSSFCEGIFLTRVDMFENFLFHHELMSEGLNSTPSVTDF
jgi:hypothetical protein